MKPCEHNKNSLAWLAIGALEPAEALHLRRHMDECDGCRSYFDEMTLLARVLADSKVVADPRAVLSESFHRKLASQIRNVPRSSERSFLFGLWARCGTGWRLAAATAVTLLGLGLVLLSAPRIDRHPAPASQAASKVPVPSERTLSFYRSTANESLDELDKVLTLQAALGSHPAETFRVSSAGELALEMMGYR